MWRGILVSQNKFYEGIEHKVMDGNNTKFWSDTWCDVGPLAIIFARLYRISSKKNSTVAEHFTDGVWDLQLRRRRLRGGEEEEMAAILNILTQVDFTAGKDRWVWKWSKNKIFTVRTMYRELLIDQCDYPNPTGYPAKYGVGMSCAYQRLGNPFGICSSLAQQPKCYGRDSVDSMEHLTGCRLLGNLEYKERNYLQRGAVGHGEIGSKNSVYNLAMVGRVEQRIRIEE
ncbi:hypothetical protein FRX31_022281 [Thalictrum thalictroides]|uniref:Uncharacterized protein n=1 Tax=Thalictrum thalictroides TaxID=46969 RepID=A0A7J6VUR7_THATH|nr:hypothetical protein FRX31_022281 [Thalictrum thalictroides]